MKSRYLKFIIAAIAFLFLAETVRADTIFLRGGERIFGKITNQSRTSLTIRAAGRTRTISKRRVRRVQYGSPADDARRRRAYESRARMARKKRADEAREKETARRAAEKRQKEIAAAKKRRVADRAGFDWSGRLGAAWRSALLPGWGHYHSGDKLFAYIHGGLFTAVLGYAVSANAAASAAQGDYENTLTRNLVLAGPVLSSLEINNPPPNFLVSLLLNTGTFSPYEAKRSRANSALGFVGLVYVAQITHAFISGGKPANIRATTEGNRPGEWRIAVKQKRDGTSIAFETSF